MKLTKVLRILGVMLILSTLSAVIPAMPAFAAINEISLSPTTGAIGDSVTIVGENWDAYTPGSHEYWAEIYFAKDNVTLLKLVGSDDVNTYRFVGESDDSIDSDGFFEATFTVPSRLSDGTDDEDVTAGDYYVYVTIYRDDTGDNYIIRAKEGFTVTAAGTLNPISPASGSAGTDVSLSGVNFPSGTIYITMDGAALPIKSGSTQTSGGSFISTVTIPSTAAIGIHNITVTVGTATATQTFNVTSSPALNDLSPSTGPAGTDVTVSGTGFPAGAITITFNDTALPIKDGNTETSGGNFASIVTVPSSATFGVYTIKVTVGTASAEKPFTATTTTTTTTTTPTTTPTTTTTTTPPPPTTPVLTLSANNQHNIGANIGMSGTGFNASAEVTVSFDGEEVGAATADPNGTLVVIFPVPVAEHGEHTISATDGTHTGTITYTIESTPPETPQPLKPAMETKVKSPVDFEWEPAIDASPPSNPITYQLQIATTEGFSSSSIILDKTDLEDTAYTLTPAEELELTGKAPYYWRIRSLDAASNPSPWTGAGVFYASGSSSFPSWATYTIMGVGAVVVFLIGYWLGRRSAFYY